MNRDKSSQQVKKLAGLALFTAIVIALQFVGSFIRFGMFSISLVLVPIVVGAAMYGRAAGAYLGAVFGVVVLLSGDAAPFMVVNPAGTIITVMLKGILAGFGAGCIYKLFEKKNRYGGVLASAIACPVINTGVFLVGCLVFFMSTVGTWAAQMGFGDAVGRYMLLGLVGWNFVFELLANIILSNVIFRIINIGRKNLGGQ